MTPMTRPDKNCLYQRRLSKNRSILRFNERHAANGGYAVFAKLSRKKDVTLQEIGDRFGMTREGVRQFMAIFGLRGYQMVAVVPSPNAKQRVRNLLFRWIISHDMLIGEFCRAARISPPEMSLFLSGRKELSYDKLSRIKEVTGLTLEEIIFMEGKEVKPDEQLQTGEGA